MELLKLELPCRLLNPSDLGFFVTLNGTLSNILTLNLPTMTVVAQPFNVIKWQLKFNPVA